MPDITYVCLLNSYGNSPVYFVDSTRARIFVGYPSMTVSF